LLGHGAALSGIGDDEGDRDDGNPGLHACLRRGGTLVWPAACFEYAAGLCLLLGYWARPVAALLAGWCLLTALIFHRQFSDLDQLMNFFKNLTMAGGFLWVAKADPGRARVDAPSPRLAGGNPCGR
jgi:putative oxidoreductase